MPDSDLQLTFGADASGVTQGVEQATASIDDFRPKVEALGKSFGDLASELKEGLGGLQGIAKGLQSAGAEGSAGLAGLAEAGGGAVGVVAAVADAAASAASAMADWAARTINSSTATAEARENATNLSAAFAEANKTFGAAGDILANAFAPAVTQLVGVLAGMARSFVDAYNQGGVLNTGLDWLIDGLRATFVPAMALGEAFAQAWIVIKGAWGEMSADWAVVQQLFAAGCGAIEASFKSLSTTIADAIAGNWVGAAQSAMQGVAAAAQAVQQHSAAINAAMDTVAAHDQAIVQESTSEWTRWSNNLIDLFAKAAPPLPPREAEPARSQSAWNPPAPASAQQPALQQAPAPQSPAPASDAIAPADQQKLTAVAAPAVQSGGTTAQATESQQQPTPITASGVGNGDTTAQATESQQQPAAANASGAEDAAAVAQATELQQKLTAANTEGIEDRARDDQKAAVDQFAADKAVLGEKIAAVQLAAAEGKISATEEAAQIAGLRQQEVQNQLQAADQVYQIQQAALAKRLSLYAKDSPAYQAVLEQEARLAAQYADQITKIKADALKQQDDARKADLEKFKREWDSAIDPLVSSFTKGLLQMAEGAKSFAQVMSSLGQQILNDFLSKVIDPMIEKWLWKEARQTAATLLGLAQRSSAETVANSAGQGQALAQTLMMVKQDAAKVFGGIFAALSSNPATLPAAAPAAAAGAAAVMSFSYAEGGWADVPADNMPTLLHAQEMVLPARLANPMRSMMDDYAASRSAPWSQPAQPAAGDNHVHNYNISAMDAGSFQSFLRGNKNPLSTVLQEMGRAGMKTA